MAGLRQYPTDQEIKDSYDACLKGEQALVEFIRAQRVKRAAEKTEAEKASLNKSEQRPRS